MTTAMDLRGVIDGLTTLAADRDTARALTCDVITRFDVDYDVPFRRHHALGILEIAGGFRAVTADDPDPIQAAIHVGAWWCRIVDHDVSYLLLHGLEAIAESTAVVRRLTTELERAPAGQAGFVAYVVARWWDGAGKLYYRCGDMATAREYFHTAYETATRAGLWACLPDLDSNRLRAPVDEKTMSGAQRIPVSDHERLREAWSRARPSALARGVPLDRVIEDHRAAALALGDGDHGPLAMMRLAHRLPDPDQREFLRGCASLLHNLSVTTGGADSLALSLESTSLCLALRDHYRLAQTLGHQARWAKAAGDRASRLRAIALAEIVQRSGWQRGRWMATQIWAQATVETAVERAEEAAVALERQIADIDEHRRRRGHELGIDVDVLRHSVAALRTVIAALPDAKRADWEQRADRRLLEAARSVRGVVKVSMYKRRFAEDVFPIYLDAIAREPSIVAAQVGTSGSTPADRESWMNVLWLVEEASSRELLDILDASRGDGDWSSAVDERPPPREQQPSHAAPVSDGRGHARRRASSDTAGGHDERIHADRIEFERHALDHPIVSARYNPEIGNELRRYTACHRGTAIVRYFLSGISDRNGGVDARPLHVLAAVFAGGRPARLVSLMSYDELTDLAGQRRAETPTRGQASELWQRLLAPVWPHVCTGDELDQLVLIPCNGMMGVAIHAAAVPAGTPGARAIAGAGVTPLAAAVPLSFSVSATAFISRGRHLLRHQPVDVHDDLCALVPGVGEHAVNPAELGGGLAWARGRDRHDYFHLAGARPPDLAPEEFSWWGPGDRIGLECLIRQEPEFFVYAGHGRFAYDRATRSTEVALQLADGDSLSEYAIATRCRLPRNKWTILGACVSGQGIDAVGGEVAGFLRAFVAAGAGAIVTTLWPVRDDVMGRVVGALLAAAASRRGTSEPVDIVAVLQAAHRAESSRITDAAADLLPACDPGDPRDISARVSSGPGDHLAERCPLVVYL